MKPKVSVIVPVYNVERYLDRCVQSIRNQTLRDIEIILVDDGSPDNCPAMCDSYAQLDSRIKVVHKQNAGLGMACNSGIENATGEYIAFCDSDDWVDKEMYETMYNTAIQNDSDAVYTGIRRVDQKGEFSILAQSNENKKFQGETLLDFMFGIIGNKPEEFLERERQMSAKIVLYSGKIIRDYNIRFHSEREYISEDLLFNLDFLSKAICVYELAAVFYNYYVNTESLSLTVRKDRFDKNKRIREYLIGAYDFSERNNEFRQRCNRMFIGYARFHLEQIVTSDLSMKDKLGMMKKMCDDPIWKQLSNDYPINKLPISKRLIFEFTKNHHFIFLYLLFKLK